MATGLPTPKSREQLLSDMLTEYVGLTGINDLNTGSAMTQFFDVVARSVARTSGDIFQILRDFSVDRATGEALNRIGDEERVFRRTSQVGSGIVKVSDSSFNKISTKIYSGASAPNIGSIIIRVSDASLFTTPGIPPYPQLYIGRGTPNIEGPLKYTSVAQVGAFWEITLDTPTSKFHNISESVILGQGGTRNVPVNTAITAPGTGATADVNYSVSSVAILLDGENENNAVQVVAQEPGSLGNAPVGTVREFTTPPFTSAIVINEVPFTTGADSESDDDYRDRIKKERLSRGLGTALAVKNAVLGAQAPDENARVTSNEIDTTNVEQTVLYIDNGEGYEEKSEGVGLEFVVDSAIGGEQNFQLTTGGRQTSVAKAFLQSSESAPFIINSLNRLAILVGGVISEHIFPTGVFQAEGAATAYEVVASINDDSDLTFEATTAESGTKVVIRAKAENDEFLQLTIPSTGTDAGPNIGFPSNEVATVLLYKNRELLNKNGRSAFVITKEKFNWSPSITDSDTLTISIDGTAEITYLILDTDFLSEGQHSTVSNQNSLSSWVNVLNNKITGATAEINGEQLKLTSNLGPSNRAGIAINPASSLVSKGMFSPDLGLTASGNEADFEISRNTSQIKLNIPLSAGDSLNLGSEFTRAEIESSNILGGQTTLSNTGYVWVLVDDVDATPVTVGITAETFLDVATPGGDIVRYISTSLTAFLNVQVGDYAIIWSDELSAGNRLEGRVSAVTATTLDLKVTNGEVSTAIPEGPILFGEGFTVIRSKQTPQKLKVDTGVYNVNSVASIFNAQLDNATVSIDDDEIFIFRTNTEDLDGGVFIVDFNDPSKALNLTKNSQSQSINSQRAFYETGFTDRQFPAFVHGIVNTEQFADPPNGYINTVDSSQNLDTLGLDPSGLLCFRQPYGDIDDVYSTECVDIQDYVGSVINVEDSYFYRRSRVNDRFQVLNGYDFGHEDSLVAVLDNDPTGKTFDMSLFRTAVTNITRSSNADNFRAYDQEGGATAEFTEFFGNTFEFDNYKALMQAKNIIDPINGALTPEDAILYRSTEWGRSGEKVGIGYFYPTTPNQGISHIVSTSSLVDIKIFLKSGPARVTTIDGTTEWNVTRSPEVGYDKITYTHSGTGSIPGLGTLLAGDYVSVITTGEFDPANIGSFKIDSATATSFTVRRATGDGLVESDIANLETNTILFFEKEDTTAQEIVDYVGGCTGGLGGETTSALCTLNNGTWNNGNITDYITATIVDDAGLTGAGVIVDSTEQDLGFSAKYIYLLDGKNYILSSDLDAGLPFPQFTFKTSLNLPTFDTITVEAYSFNNGEKIKIVPITSLHVTEFLNTLAVTGYTTLGEIKSVDRNTNLQFSTDILGTNGGIQVAGGTASAASAAIEGSASSLGSQEDSKSLITIISATSSGFFSDQWVKLFATEIQKKTTSINALNSIEISESVPTVGSSKIEIFDKSTEQRFFGRQRYHTRTRGRTFKVEDAGQFTCISWDENGTEPYFYKNINLNDIDDKNVIVTFDNFKLQTKYEVTSGSISFEETQIGDIIVVSSFDDDDNNGAFKILSISTDGKTIVTDNTKGIDNLGNVNEIQSIVFDAVPTSGDFSLEFNGEITNLIPFNATNVTVESELELLSNITDVGVTGDFSIGFTVEFLGINSNSDVPMITFDSNTLDATADQIEEIDFTGVTGSTLNNTQRIDEIDFTGVTDLDITNQIEEIDFGGLTGLILNQTQQIEDFDFNGLIGSDFDIGSTKSIQLADGLAYLWYNVTDGINAQSDPGGTGTSIRVDILSSYNASVLASETENAIVNGYFAFFQGQVAGMTTDVTIDADNVGVVGNITLIQNGTDINTLISVWNGANPGNTITLSSGNGAQIPTANIILTEGQDSLLPIVGITSAATSIPNYIITVTYDSGDVTNGSDVDTGAVYTLAQEGVNAKSIQLAGGLAYLWFDVTNGSNTQTDPTGVGTAIKIDVLNADDNSVLANRVSTAITTALPIAGISSSTDALGVATVVYDGGNISNGFDVNTTAILTVTQDGINSYYIQLAGGYAYLWYNVTDGSNTQTDPLASGAGIQVDILAADLPSNMATKTATAITTSLPLIGISSSTDALNITTVNYSLGGTIIDGFDVGTQAIYTVLDTGVNAKSIQLAGGYAYLWYNVTDGSIDQFDPSTTGIGTSIQIDVLLTDTPSIIANKTTNAITTALPIAGISSSTDALNITTVNYTGGNISDGFDVDTTAILTVTQDGTVFGSITITINEILKGEGSGSFSVSSEVQEGDNAIIGSDFNILNQGIFRVIRRFNNSIYIDNSNAIEEEVTLTSQLISFSASFATFDALVAGVAINVQLSADITGIAGDSILLTGDGVKDLNTLVLEWNTANGSNTVTLNSTNGTSVPNNLEAMQLAGGDGATGYDIDKIDGLNRLKWNGAGTEPVLENMRPGDIITLGTDFNVLNQGSFHVVDSGTKLQEITRMTMARGIDMTSGQYATLFSAEAPTAHYMWFNIAAGGGDPGITPNPMPIAVATLDSAAQVAVKVADEINLTFSADFTAIADGDDVVITTVEYGETTNAANGNIAGTFSLVIEQDGRRNFANYINVNGITETGIVIADVLEFHKEAVQFKEYNGVLPGDSFIISSNFLGIDNVGIFVITDVLSESEILVNSTLVNVDKTLLDSNFNKVYIEEKSPYVGYKKIEYIATNPANLNNKNIVFDSENQFGKINEIAGVSMSAVSKMSFPSNIIRGVDSYKYNTGLIAESNRIVYGDPRDNTTYPGVGAAGAEIFIKAPLVRRIQVSINVRIKTGVPFTTIVEEVRNAIAALINSNDVGQPISISNIISRVDVIGGIQAVAISSPQYDAQNDVIKVNAGEKALVLDIISDILVSKID